MEKSTRTALDLLEELMLRAMSLVQIKTKTQVITLALQELIREVKLSELRKFKGKINLETGLSQIRNRI